MTDHHANDDQDTEDRIHLGIGESVSARLPTNEEQARFGIDPQQPVFVVHHPERGPEVFPSDGVIVSPLTYGGMLR